MTTRMHFSVFLLALLVLTTSSAVPAAARRQQTSVSLVDSLFGGQAELEQLRAAQRRETLRRQTTHGTRSPTAH